MKKILVIFSGLLLFLSGIILFIGYSFNSENYKKQFISTLSDLTGRKVEVGEMTLTWTPFPTMLISNLSVSNQEEGKVEKMFLSEKVYVEISWSSLFKNPLIIKKVTFQKPEIFLERIKSYQTNFDFPYLFNPSKSFIESASLMGKNEFSLKIREFVVENGRFNYINHISKENYSVFGISGTGTVLSLNGPFSFEGKFSLNNTPKKISLKIGKIEASQNLPLSIDFFDEKSSTKITSKAEFLFGQKTSKEWFKLLGTITSQNPTSFFEGFGLSAWPKGILSGNFTVNVMPNKTVFDNITLRQEEEDLQTTFFWGKEGVSEEDSLKEPPSLIIENMDYKKWHPILENLSKVPFLDQLKTKFSLRLESIKLNSQMIKAGKGQGTLDGGALSFEDLIIQLPYSGALSLKGKWDFKKSNLDADLQLQTNDFYSTLRWIFPKTTFGSDFDMTKIKNLQFFGHVQWDPQKILLETTEAGNFEGTSFSGQMKLDFSNGLDADLNLNIARLNLDTFFVSDLQKLTDFSFPKGKYVFDLTGQDITVKEHHFNQLNLKGDITEDNLLLNEFLFDDADKYSFKGKGSFQKLGKKDFSITNLEMDYSMSNLKKFMKEMKISSDNPLMEKEAPLNGSLTYSGNLSQGSLQTSCQFEQAQIKLTGKGESLISTNPQFQELDFSLNYPEIQLFLSSLNDDLKKLFPFLKGDLKIQLKGKGTYSDFKASQIDLAIGKQNFNGTASWNLTDRDVKFKLKTPNLDLNNFLPKKEDIYPFDNTPININVLPEWAGELEINADKLSYNGQRYKDMTTRLLLKGQVLNISNFKITSEKGEEKISFDGNITFRKPFSIDGNYTLSNFHLKDGLKMGAFSFSNGKGNLKGSFSTSGFSMEEFVKNLTGEGVLDLKNGTLWGMDIQELSAFSEKVFQHTQQESAIPLQVQHALSSGKTELSSISSSFSIKKGEVSTEEVKAKTRNASVYLQKLKWSLLSGKFSGLFSILLDRPENLPSLELSVSNAKVANKTEAFEQSLKNEVRRFLNQKQEAIEQKNRQETENKREELLVFASRMLEQADYLMKQIQDRVTLDPSLKSDDLVAEVDKNIQEVRQLVIRSELNKEQMIVLDEKSKLLEIQLKELEAFQRRQDVSRQKKAMDKLLPLVEKKLNDIIQIYKKNPNSSLLIGLIQGVQKEEKEIKSLVQSLSKSVDVDEAEKMILQIKESFSKVQKAWNYAQKINSTGEIAPSVSGTILGK